MTTPVKRRLFTVDEYHRMAEAGLLGEDDRVELIDGEVLEMAPIGSRHAACVNRINRLFQKNLDERVVVSVQNPVRLSMHSEPQPDVTLLRARPDDYESALPGPEDVLLVVEVADSSIGYDRGLKIPLYAANGITEVWLIDLEARTVETYGSPEAAGYRERHVARTGDSLTLNAFPDVKIAVDEILGS
jgi:Uma2 family endonuclease